MGDVQRIQSACNTADGDENEREDGKSFSNNRSPFPAEEIPELEKEELDGGDVGGDDGEEVDWFDG